MRSKSSLSMAKCRRFWILVSAVAVLVGCSTDGDNGSGDGRAQATAVTRTLRGAYIRAIQDEAPPGFDVRRGATGIVAAVNPTQRFSARFEAAGVSLTSDDSVRPWKLGFRLDAVGCGGGTASLPSAEPAFARNRVDYRRTPSVNEWYIHGPLGLEHGFRLTKRPSCLGEDGGRIEAEVRLDTKLRPEMAPSGTWISIKGDAGVGVLRYSDLFAYDARGARLEADMHVRNGRIVLGVDVSSAVFPVTVDPLISTELGQLIVDDQMPKKYVGSAVAISGDTAVVGASLDSDDADQAGAVYVFQRTGSLWYQYARIANPQLDETDEFGAAVALSGDTAVVGAPGDDDEADSAGAAYVYVRTGTSWAMQAKLTAADGIAQDRFGVSVAVDGDTISVGAPSDTGAHAGKAYVFTRSGTSWSAGPILTASDTVSVSRFGESLAMEGSRILVGAPDTDYARGAVYAFANSGGWAQVGKLHDPASESLDRFGFAVALRGTVAVAGAFGVNAFAGAAYVFEDQGSGWNLTQKLTASDADAGDHFGIAVALDDAQIVIGASHDSEKASWAGAVYTFHRPASSWVQAAKLMAADGKSSAMMGGAIAVDGSVLTGAPQDSSKGADAGAAYVFTGTGTTWTQQAKLTVVHRQQGDNFGYSLDLDGDRAVVGAPYFPSNGTVSGAAYVFERSSGSWFFRKRLYASDGAMNDQFGYDVAVDGTTIVVGAPSAGAGAVYVYSGTGTAWTEQAKLSAPGGGSGDYFGESVDLDGDVLIAGAGRVGPGQGAAYVFERTGAAWNAGVKIPVTGVADYDYYGQSVAIDGDTIAVGAFGDDVSANESGAVYVHVRSGATWTQQAKLKPSDPSVSLEFGTSLALKGDRVVTGTPYGEDQGRVYVFTRSGVTWSQTVKLLAGDAENGDEFGMAVAVDEDIVVVGASNESENATGGGAVYAFLRDGTSWVQTKLFPATGVDWSKFGHAVAYDKTTLLASAPNGDGRVYVLSLLADEGDPCTSAAQCESGFCVDGVCCDIACTNGCMSCAAALKESGSSDGECGPTAHGTDPGDDCTVSQPESCGYDGTCNGSGACAYFGTAQACLNSGNSRECEGTFSKALHCDGLGTCSADAVGTNCSPFACSPTTGQCLTTCASDADCVGDNYCNGSNVCAPKLSNGAACATGNQCLTSFCVDDVCCNQACTGTCRACSQAKKAQGADGDCGFIAEGSPSDGDCADQGAITCGQNSRCDGQGFCQRYPAGTQCGTSVCSGNDVIGQICDGAGSCTNNTTGLTCAPYQCVAGGCANPCTTSAHCLSGYYCSTSGTCAATQPDGAACGGDGECQSGHCVDSVCCDTACSNTCQACAASLKASGVGDGVCGPAAVDTDPHDDCSMDAQATCDQSGACDGVGACRLYPAGTSCGPTVCQGAEVFGQVCDGWGNCGHETNGLDCNAYVCKNGSCLTSCSEQADCSAGHYCDGSTCVALLQPGAACTEDGSCASQFCVDGVCCDTACEGQCEACDVAGSEGACGPVTGAPHSPRPACGGTEACGGACDGQDRTNCVYPGSAVICSTTCTAGTAVTSTCDGAGKCVAGAGKPCSPYVCDGDACAVACSGNGDCDPPATCSATGVCQVGPGTDAGTADAAVEAGGGAAEPTDEGGCGCRVPVGSSRGARGGAWLLLALLLIRRTPRKRRSLDR